MQPTITTTCRASTAIARALRPRVACPSPLLAAPCTRLALTRLTAATVTSPLRDSRSFASSTQSNSAARPRKTHALTPNRSGNNISNNNINSSQTGSSSTSSGSQQIGHAKSTVVRQLQDLLTQASSTRGFEPDTDFFRRASSALQAAQTREQLRAALPLCKLVERAATMHGSATTECVRIYEALGRHRDAVELAFALLRRDFFLMNSVLTSAIQACAALRETDRGVQLFELAVARGTIPTRNVFGALLGLCAAAGDAPSSPRVAKLLQAMGDAQLEMNHSTLHHWMTSYARHAHYTQMDELRVTMRDAYGLEPVENTYAILMDASAERGDFDATMALLRELKRADGLKVALVHYNVALKACGKTSRLSQAFQLYEEMKEHTHIRPDLVTYITMMHAVYHGELGAVDARKVQAALGGVALTGLAAVPFIDWQEQLMTVLFCSSLVGSMGLAVYMNPDGALRALYPNTDEAREPLIAAFFRRLREEDHCGRSMYLWREMLKHGVSADSRVYDVLVRTCVKKRHPELAFEAVFQQHLPLVDAHGAFVLPLPTTVAFLHALLAQRRVAMADTLFDAARSHRVFQELFTETRDQYVYDLRAFSTLLSRSFVIRRILTTLHAESKLFGAGGAPRIEFVVFHGFELLDQLDKDDVQVRALFAMDEMKKETVKQQQQQQHSQQQSGGGGQYYFRLSVPSERLAEYFATPLATPGGSQTL